MRLHQGDALYREVFWVFPPGHLLPAWIAVAIDPPGIIATRMIYAAFTVALCLSLYSLGRRFMPERYALFGSLLLAVAAPVTHYDHQVFGYRYLVFSVITLLFFDQRLRTRKHIWM